MAVVDVVKSIVVWCDYTFFGCPAFAPTLDLLRCEVTLSRRRDKVLKESQ